MDKETFFKELFELDEPDTFDGDVDGLLTTLRANRPPQRHGHLSQSSSRRRSVHTSRPIQPFRRVVSAPLSTDSPKVSPIDPLHEVKDTRGATMLRSRADEVSRLQPGTPVGPRSTRAVTKMSAATNKKRKRARSLEILPEAQQIFRGLRFCS